MLKRAAGGGGHQVSVAIPALAQPLEWGAVMADTNLSAFIWSVADLLRGDYKQSEYGKVILPFTILRRLDCVLAPTKAAVLEEYETRKKAGLNPEPFLQKASGGLTFHSTSKLDLKTLMGDQADVARQHGLTRARLTQLMNLLLLAPDIQEEILALEVPAGRQPLSERALRQLTESLLWTDQRVMWRALQVRR